MRGRPPQPLTDRLLAKVEFGESPSDCWTWTGSLRQGYGQISIRTETGRTTAGAHRVAYELAVGPIPVGLEPDHLCRNTVCVNPDHLELVTRKVNILRGEGPAAVNARKRHCASGHQIGAARYSDGRRRCLVCDPQAVTGEGSCDHCRTTFERKGRGRRQRFCSTQCRVDFHNERRRAA